MLASPLLCLILRYRNDLSSEHQMDPRRRYFGCLGIPSTASISTNSMPGEGCLQLAAKTPVSSASSHGLLH